MPEPVVNDLFRANLWHALRLPRRHGGQGPGVKIDLPYTNFAYGQDGTPWPINQAVYVDDMIYDLRGYHDVSLEELLCIYQNNQGPDGHVGGYANWGVYTPGMLYASARYFLLSQDRAGFERLLPATLKSMDWCLVGHPDRPRTQPGVAEDWSGRRSTMGPAKATGRSIRPIFMRDSPRWGTPSKATVIRGPASAWTRHAAFSKSSPMSSPGRASSHRSFSFAITRGALMFLARP